LNGIARYIASVVAVVLGIWLMLTFGAPLSILLTPLIGDSALILAMVVLAIGPGLLLAVLTRRFL
jgi:hypothetical protein